MRILIEPGTYLCRNVGDLAMLQVTVARLRQLWPRATVEVVTNAPDLLSQACPGTVPVPAAGSSAWFGDAYLLGRVHRLLPAAMSRRLQARELDLRVTRPRLMKLLLRLRPRRSGELLSTFRQYVDVALKADLIVVSGMGSLNDAFRQKATAVLNTLALAHRRRTPTAMFSQGIGPLHDGQLVEKARGVLPHVRLIGVREARKSPALLGALGVPDTRVAVTGDDAIELAYPERRDEFGTGLGINLRLATYAGLDASVLTWLRPALHADGQRLGATLVPIPISHRANAGDARTLVELMRGYPGRIEEGTDLQTPLEVIRQVGRCRVVVTGSYHAAVFALAQGVPAICLANSEYYRDKFAGLADQFPAGCVLVNMDEPGVSERLSASVAEFWRSAQALRPGLLSTAVGQIGQSRSAYQRLRELVEPPRAAA